MRRVIRVGAVLAFTVAAFAGFGPQAAFAHEHRVVDGIETTVGWLEEPAYAGFRNAVFLELARASGAHDDGDDHTHTDTAGAISDAELKVVVTFGGPDGERKTEPMDLLPAFGAPGEYHAFLIPTRAGTYTFRITGTVAGKDFDETYTSGEDTFNDIRESSAIEFPEADPSRGELAQKSDRTEQRLTSVGSTADDASGTASTALLVAIGGAVLGGAGIGLALKAQKRQRG